MRQKLNTILMYKSMTITMYHWSIQRQQLGNRGCFLRLMHPGRVCGVCVCVCVCVCVFAPETATDFTLHSWWQLPFGSLIFSLWRDMGCIPSHCQAHPAMPFPPSFPFSLPPFIPLYTKMLSCACCVWGIPTYRGTELTACYLIGP